MTAASILIVLLVAMMTMMTNRLVGVAAFGVIVPRIATKTLRASLTTDIRTSSLLFSTTTSTSQDTSIAANDALAEPTTVASRVFASDTRPVILFDGVCNLCNGAVNLALDWDPQGKLRFAALQSNVGRALLQANGRVADDISSIILVTRDGAFTKSDAVLRIAEELTPLPLLPLRPAASLGRLVIPKVLRDVVYDGVAENRYNLMGKRDECRLDNDGAFQERFVDDSIALKA